MLLAESALEDRPADAVRIALEPLSSIPLSGELVLARPVTGLEIEASYHANWGHDFFGIADGAVQTFTVARSKVAADGTFTLNIPDFERDPVVASYSGYARGALRLRVRESSTGNIPYTLEDTRNRGREAEVAIAANYPKVFQLVVGPR